jgi:hypothetical protein
MFCTRCGQRTGSSKFCTQCGAALDARAHPGSAPPPDPPARSSAPLSKADASDSAPATTIPCPICKEDIRFGALKCKHCDSDLTHRVQTPDRNLVVDPRIRDELRKYKEEITLQCRECGYFGPMGIVKQITPWWNRWFIWIPLCIAGVGFVALAILGICGALASRYKVVCPACRRTLVQKT